MHTRTYVIAGVAIAIAIVASVISSVQGFDAGKVPCEGIAAARSELQSSYETGVDASVRIYAEERTETEERLSSCLSAKPLDPCADAQKARDVAVEAYTSIPSPRDDAPYAEFQTYFKKRDEAYSNYKKAKDALDSCRAANPPKEVVPYEQSDTKACFDAYDASIDAARDVFDRDTQTMRSALNAALAALDAREKACNPPKGKSQFTEPPRGDDDSAGSAPTDLMNCKLLKYDSDTELAVLRKRAAAIPGEIQAVSTSVDNIMKRMNPLQRDLKDVDTYIPPESARTQFEGALNALRAERKLAIESSLEFYKDLLARKQAEKASLESELRDVESKIAQRIARIDEENAARRRNYPTTLHLGAPDECAYYHCHGLLCGRQDPDPHGCGHGSTEQTDVSCERFLDSYLRAAGVN